MYPEAPQSTKISLPAKYVQFLLSSHLIPDHEAVVLPGKRKVVLSLSQDRIDYLLSVAKSVSESSQYPAALRKSATSAVAALSKGSALAPSSVVYSEVLGTLSVVNVAVLSPYFGKDQLDATVIYTVKGTLEAILDLLLRGDPAPLNRLKDNVKKVAGVVPKGEIILG